MRRKKAVSSKHLAKGKKRDEKKARPDVLTIDQVAERFRVSVKTVRKWRGRGLPESGRGARRALLFDIDGVEKWLASQGIVPGAEGAAGGRARARAETGRAKRKKARPPVLLTTAQVRDTFAGGSEQKMLRWRREGLEPDKIGPRKAHLFDPTKVQVWLAGREQPRKRTPATTGNKGEAPARVPESPGPPCRGISGNGHDRGLQSAQRRVEEMEELMGSDLLRMLRHEGDEDPLAALAGIKNYKELVEVVRKVDEGVLKLMEARRELIPRADFQDSLLHLAAVFRSNLNRLPSEIGPRLTTALGTHGVEVSDLGAFQRAVQQEAKRFVADFLRTMGAELAAAAPESPLDEASHAAS